MNIVKRILAYLIDMMLVTILSSCLSTLPMINMNYNEYENKVEKYEDKRILKVKRYEYQENIIHNLFDVCCTGNLCTGVSQERHS